MRSRTAVLLPLVVAIVAARREVSAQRSEIELAVENTGSAEAFVQYRVCAFLVQGHTHSGPTATPRWSSHQPQQGGCQAKRLYGITVPAHSVVQHVVGVIPADLVVKGSSMSLQFRVAGEAGIRKLQVSEYIID
jgi:hypothetical protein